MSKLRIETMVLGMVSTNTYILYKEGENQAVIVDPAACLLYTSKYLNLTGLLRKQLFLQWPCAILKGEVFIMKLLLVLKTARCAVIMAEDGSAFEAETPYQVYLNGRKTLESRRLSLIHL